MSFIYRLYQKYDTNNINYIQTVNTIYEKLYRDRYAWNLFFSLKDQENRESCDLKANLPPSIIKMADEKVNMMKS